MCGISGYISHKRITLDTLTMMNDTMYHRGPDDSGVELYDASNGYTVGFAQRRLSILDLSPLGHQPMHSNDKRISVVFNGEIYNFQEIREDLIKSGYSFNSNSDTEVIINGYDKWGIDVVNRFNGMFAIALFDRKEDVVYLVRDRIGKKPLYYELEEGTDGFNLYFASELKPIMARPDFIKDINTPILSRYLFQLCINAPDSIFNNVYKLQPGAILRFDLNRNDGRVTYEAGAISQVSIYKYWDVSTVYKKMQENPVTDYDEAKSELKRLLRKAVELRMISDVPLGTFLSGGYDSSLTTAIAQELSNEPVKTFSIGFNEEKYNEAKFAKEVSNYLGTDHTELYISEEDMYDMVNSIPKYYDEPFADSSQVCTMLVSKLARERVTVAISGDGGDEFFCGYNEYKMVNLAQKLDPLGAIVYGLSNLPVLKQLNVLNKLPFKVRVIASNRNPLTKTQLGSDNYIKLINNLILGEKVECRFPIEDNYDVKNWQTKRMLVDMDTYLPGDILCKVDRASMKYSLESRCPILDKDVMEYSFRLDHSFKYDNGNKKRILKDIAYDYIPKELLDRPKVGFGVPLDKWLRGPLKEQLLSYADVSFLKKQGIFNPEFTANFVREYIKNGDGGPATGANYSKIAWPFFTFQQWYEEYM